MDKDKQNKRQWWGPAIFIFANITGWIAVPIVLALVLGKYLDQKYASEPWFFLGLTVIAFIISISGIVRILKRYLKNIDSDRADTHTIQK